ncbi:hypothetical protein [Companilactobacillus sp. FL22-1]|uniref:hypothetical protein n=1 Tax=Companilactobacillus sp. FL22-1 TaxID=3373892 RepID=UPI003755158E
MSQLSKDLDFRPLEKIDEAYMDAAMKFLDESQVMDELNKTGLYNINLDNLEFRHFQEWLFLAGSPDNELSFSPKKLVSFSIALTRFHDGCWDSPLSIASLDKFVQMDDVVQHVNLLFQVKPSLLLLHEIVNRH